MLVGASRSRATGTSRAICTLRPPSPASAGRGLRRASAANGGGGERVSHTRAEASCAICGEPRPGSCHETLAASRSSRRMALTPAARRAIWQMGIAGDAPQHRDGCAPAVPGPPVGEPAPGRPRGLLGSTHRKAVAQPPCSATQAGICSRGGPAVAAAALRAVDMVVPEGRGLGDSATTRTMLPAMPLYSDPAPQIRGY